MLFNSYVFVFLFVPITVAGFFLLAKPFGRQAHLVWLVAASLLFYGWWYPPYLVLLLFSITFNYGLGIAIENVRQTGRQSPRAVMLCGVAGNLGLIGYFKYAGFLSANVNAMLGVDWGVDEVLLPLGISFFTFQQIAYLMDVYGGHPAERNLLRYALFVSFFPQLIAGPIVHHGEMIPQFRRKSLFQFSSRNLGLGLTIFFIGLFKKVVIADSLATHVGPVFDQAAVGVMPDFFRAWGALLAYTFQIYFDFSGYSDMAIGLARMFGIRLPVNFDSPYKAFSIIAFWQRWHMTLSRFLRDYLYIPLGGNRKGKARRYVNLLLTMVLGGLWHGAAWTFVLWGALHGGYLVINHAWRRARPATWGEPNGLVKGAFWALTFLAVTLSWIPFRAENMEAVQNILQGLVGSGGFVMPSGLEWRMGAFAENLSALGIQFEGINTYRWAMNFLLVGAAFAISLALPNTNEIFHFRQFPKPAAYFALIKAQRLRWNSRRAWSIAAAVIAAVAVLQLASPSEFIYFNF